MNRDWVFLLLLFTLMVLAYWVLVAFMNAAIDRWVYPAYRRWLARRWGVDLDRVEAAFTKIRADREGR